MNVFNVVLAYGTAEGFTMPYQRTALDRMSIQGNKKSRLDGLASISIDPAGLH